MRFFGKKSLSSVISHVLNILWIPLLALAILAPLAGAAIVFFSTPAGEAFGAEILQGDQTSCAMDPADAKDWLFFKNLPIALKFLIVPYFGANFGLLFLIVKKNRVLFRNFTDDIVLSKSNVLIISSISKLIIAFSVLTLSFASVLIGIVLLLLCEIVKMGASLQEEVDLTV